MKHLLLFLSLVTTAVPVLGQTVSSERSQTVPSERNGQLVYDKWCTPCHGAVGPRGGFGGGALAGTAALAVKYKGQLPAVLVERTDLTPALIRTVVRRGLFGMPITRKTEISDAELEDIVAYLTRHRTP